MANALPCPNPVCSHQFSQADLQNAPQFLCPKCGFRMQGKGTAPVKLAAPAAKAAPTSNKVPVAQPAPKQVPAAPPHVPIATPIAAAPSPIPIAPPVAPAAAAEVAAGEPPIPSSTADEGSLADGMFFNPGIVGDTGTLVRTGIPRREFSWLRLLLVTFALGFSACVVIVAFALVIWLLLGSGAFNGSADDVDGVVHIGSIRDAKGANEKIYKLVLPKKEWLVDNEIKDRFKAHAAFKHGERDFWFALVVQDHGVNRPRDAEMLRFAIDKLEIHFADALELSKMAEPVKVGPPAQRLDAQKIQFKGQVKAAFWLGECYMFFNNGVGYWLFVASPDWAEVSEHLGPSLVEKQLTVLSERRGWREQPPATESFASVGAKVSVIVPKGIWERNNPKDEDPNGELFLFGRYQKEKDNRKNATLLVVALEKKADLSEAVKAAREYLDKKIKEENEQYRLVDTEKGAGAADAGTVDVGDRRGRMLDLKRTLNDEAQRYILAAVINEEDVSYVVRCECSWENRQIWRQEFLDALRSMRIKKTD